MENLQVNERESKNRVSVKVIAIGIAAVLFIIGISLLCIYFLEEGQVLEGTLV